MPNQFITVLGTVQDAGFPQASCFKACCRHQWDQAVQQKFITSLGVVDRTAGKIWMLDASPDFKYQIKQLSDCLHPEEFQLPDGIFLTHGHIGHYTGLMQLGREAIGAKGVPVYGMPRMRQYLTDSGPWSQLVLLNNIALQPLEEDSTVQLSEDLKITPFLVPHRSEYTETVGFRVEGPNQKVLFIPDIDKWHLWDRDIRAEISNVDAAFLDGTFYKNGEVGNRDMSTIPHPFIEESMMLFDSSPTTEKAKVNFIHLNHTNPVLHYESPEWQEVIDAGYKVAYRGQQVKL